MQGAVDQRGGRNAREPLAMAASNLIDVWTSEFQKFSAMIVRMRRGRYEEDEEEGEESDRVPQFLGKYAAERPALRMHCTNSSPGGCKRNRRQRGRSMLITPRRVQGASLENLRCGARRHGPRLRVLSHQRCAASSSLTAHRHPPGFPIPVGVVFSSPAMAVASHRCCIHKVIHRAVHLSSLAEPPNPAVHLGQPNQPAPSHAKFVCRCEGDAP